MFNFKKSTILKLIYIPILLFIGFLIGLNVPKDNKILSKLALNYSIAKPSVEQTITPIPESTEYQISERALKVASSVYWSSSKASRKEYQKKYASSSGELVPSLIIEAMAKLMDKDKVNLISAEAWLEKYKQEMSQPVYEAPSVNIQAPAAPAAPSRPVFENTSPTNCTTNYIGDSAYTRCY